MRTDPFPATSMPNRDWWAFLFPDPEGMLRRLSVAAGMTVLDLCCGDGYFTAAIAKITNGQVYGFDLDAKLIEQAREEVKARHLSALGWFVGDALDVAQLVPAPVDYVLIANTFHGVPDKPRLLQKVAQVLRPGGLLGIVNWHARAREETVVLGQPRGPATELRMESAALHALADGAGFATDRLVELPPYHYGLVARPVSVSTE